MSDIPLVDLVRARRQGLTSAIAGTQGATGPTGIGIVSANSNAAGNITFVLSNSNTLTIASLTAGLIPLANLKSIVAISTDFADFKSKVANIVL